MADELTRVFVLIRLQPSSAVNRVHQDVPQIMELLRSHSRGDQEFLFRTDQNHTFGVLLRTPRPWGLRAEFQRCPGTRDGDAILVFEAGDHVGDDGFGSAAAWLQLHK